MGRRRIFLPIVFLILVNLIAGILTFQDYGMAWDEPLFYQYADAIPYAYSPREWLSGDFDLENAYGPSEDHKNYGPAYLLLVKPAVDILEWSLPVKQTEAWHLVNFVAFQAGVVLLHALCRRWMGEWAAAGAALLFATQPVLWGHAIINPKDMPFMTFFMAAVYLGFKMVDGLSAHFGDLDLYQQALPSLEQDYVRWQKIRKLLQVTGIVLVLISGLVFVFSVQLLEALDGLIRHAYQAESDSVLGWLFGVLAVNAGSVPVEAYINKAVILFSRLRSALGGLTVMVVLPALLLTFWLPGVRRVICWLVKILSPMPGLPAWWVKGQKLHNVVFKVLLAGIVLGLLTAVRVLGPLAGILVCLYFLSRYERRPLAGMIVYGLIALAVMYVAWPYLWQSPLARFIEVFRHMSHNPKILPVLFNGEVYPSDGLPVSYLPVMLGITMTLPTWGLFLVGLGVAAWRVKLKRLDWRSLLPTLLWFLVPFCYVLITRPPMYDSYRHFLFMLPPVFVFAGLALQIGIERLRRRWASGLLIVMLALPGIVGVIVSQPYPYTYYNVIVGGTGGAFRQFETDYWLTCYRELMEQVNRDAPAGTTLFVHRQPAIAREYASASITVEPFDPDDDQTFSGSWLLLTTRANVDLILHPEATQLHAVGREGAVFCLVRQIP